jgi:hypothetical protein
MKLRLVLKNGLIRRYNGKIIDASFTHLNLEVETYNSKGEPTYRSGSLAFARIQKVMMDMEIEILSEIEHCWMLFWGLVK